MKTTEQLKEHLYTHKDAIVIFGSNMVKELNHESKFNEENLKTFSRKTLRKSPLEFWLHFKRHIYKEFNTKTSSQELLLKLNDKGLIKTIYNQSTDGIIEQSAKNVHSIKGNINSFICQNKNCEILYTDNYVMSLEDEVPKCECCGAILRPNMLLSGENYSDEIYDQIREDIINTHTLIVLGLDIKEQLLLDLIADFGDIKSGENEESLNTGDPTKEKMLIVIQEEDQDFNFNEVAFCEFLVKDNLTDALRRLCNILN